MQPLLKVLVVVIFIFSVTVFGVSLMYVYAIPKAPNDIGKKVADLKNKSRLASERLKELKDARSNAKEVDQGIEYWQGELGKAKNANDRREKTEYPELMQGLTTTYAQDRTKFEKTEDENTKAAERTLADKQRSLKEMRTKVQQSRVERDKARGDIEGLELQKKELLNRTLQSTIQLDDVQKRNQTVTSQLEAAKKASTGTAP